jgi:hypothetical protein
MLDFIRFDDDFVLAKMYPPKFIRGIGLNESGVRSKYNVTVVGVKSPASRSATRRRHRGDEPRPHHRVGHQQRHRAVRLARPLTRAARRAAAATSPCARETIPREKPLRARFVVARWFLAGTAPALSSPSTRVRGVVTG